MKYQIIIIFYKFQNISKINTKANSSFMITQPLQQADSSIISQHLKHQLQESKTANRVKSINLSLMDQIFDDIENQSIIIPKNQKPFKLRKSHEINHSEQAMSQLITKKQQIEDQLKKIELQQLKLHINQSRLGLNQSKVSQTYSASRMFKSNLTEEQKEKIKQVIQSQKKFIKNIKQKESKYKQEIEEDRKKNLQIEENIKKEKCQERKKYWQKIKDQIAKRQEQRKLKLIEDQQRLKEVKKSKKLYEVLQDSWNDKTSKDQNLIKQATLHMKENHKFDLLKIIQHQKQFDRIAKEKQEARQKSKEQFQESVKLTLPRINSKFLVTVKEEQKQKRLEEQERQNRRFELSHKKHEFAQKVRQQFKPRIDDTLKITSRTNEQQDSVNKKPGLAFDQVRNLGNNYMKKVHKKIALSKVHNGEDSKVSEAEPLSQPLYKNYLNELKEKRGSDEIKSNLTNEVHKIMKNTCYSNIEKIQRAKIVAKRLQGKENSKSSALIRNINEKIKILNALNQD